MSTNLHDVLSACDLKLPSEGSTPQRREMLGVVRQESGWASEHHHRSSVRSQTKKERLTAMKNPKGGVTAYRSVPLTCRGEPGLVFLREKEKAPQEEVGALSG